MKSSERQGRGHHAASTPPARCAQRQRIAVLDDARAASGSRRSSSHRPAGRRSGRWRFGNPGRRRIRVRARSWVVTIPIAPCSIKPLTTDSAPTHRSWELVPLKSSSNRKRSGSGPRDRSTSCLHPGDLGIEPRAAGLERILDAQSGSDGQRREPKAGRAHRGAGQGQHRIDPDGPQQRALARHVRSADHQGEAYCRPAPRRSRRNRAVWISGWPTAWASKQAGPVASSGKMSGGFSAA